MCVCVCRMEAILPCFSSSFLSSGLVFFAHLEAGSGCKYLSLAQWIKDAFCPVGVTICLTRWINYCTSETERERMKKRNAKTQHAVRGRFLPGGDWKLCSCRSCGVQSVNSQITKKNPPHPTPGMSVGTYRSSEALPSSFPRHVQARLPDAPRLTRRRTVLPTTNGCYWSVRAHQRPTIHVDSTSGQSSTILPVFSFGGASAAEPPPPPGPGLASPTVTAVVIKRRKRNKTPSTPPVHRLSQSVDSINSVSHSLRPFTRDTLAVTSQLETMKHLLCFERVFLLLFFLGKTFVFNCFIFCTFICNISCK